MNYFLNIETELFRILLLFIIHGITSFLEFNKIPMSTDDLLTRVRQKDFKQFKVCS